MGGLSEDQHQRRHQRHRPGRKNHPSITNIKCKEGKQPASPSLSHRESFKACQLYIYRSFISITCMKVSYGFWFCQHWKLSENENERDQIHKENHTRARKRRGIIPLCWQWLAYFMDRWAMTSRLCQFLWKPPGGELNQELESVGFSVKLTEVCCVQEEDDTLETFKIWQRLVDPWASVRTNPDALRKQHHLFLLWKYNLKIFRKWFFFYELLFHSGMLSFIVLFYLAFTYWHTIFCIILFYFILLYLLFYKKNFLF